MSQEKLVSLDIVEQERGATAEFVEAIHGMDLKQNGGLHLFQFPEGQDFDPEEFVRLVRERSQYAIIPSRDGDIAWVREAQQPDGEVDNSHRTAAFDFHKDGGADTHPPVFFLLYCQEPGTSDIPTVLVDTNKIVEGLTPTEREHLGNIEAVFVKGDAHQVRPAMTTDPATNLPIINWGSYYRQRKTGDRSGGDIRTLEPRDLISTVAQVYGLADRLRTEHTWRKGQLLIIDNERYFHGRGQSPHGNRVGSPDMQRALVHVDFSPIRQARPVRRIK